MKKELSTKSEEKAKKVKKLPAAMVAKMIKKGEVRNPHGRQKGSRNRFSEAFVNDFIEHWEVHGVAALDKCFEEEIGVYMNTASKLLPKDFNINMTQEVNLDRLLDKFAPEQLRDLAIGLAALGASHKQKTIEAQARVVTDPIH